jgi:uncharacterized protein
LYSGVCVIASRSEPVTRLIWHARRKTIEVDQEGAWTMAQSNSAENNNGALPPRRDVEPRRRERGFAVMDPERRRRISSVGGKAAHEKGTAHEFTRDEAREAGRKGGRARAAARAERKHATGAETITVIPFPNGKKSE